MTMTFAFEDTSSTEYFHVASTSYSKYIEKPRLYGTYEYNVSLTLSHCPTLNMFVSFGI